MTAPDFFDTLEAWQPDPSHPLTDWEALPDTEYATQRQTRHCTACGAVEAHDARCQDHSVYLETPCDPSAERERKKAIAAFNAREKPQKRKRQVVLDGGERGGGHLPLDAEDA